MLGLIRDTVVSFFQNFTAKTVVVPAKTPVITTQEPKAEFVPPAPMKREPYNMRVRRAVNYAEKEDSEEELR
jgi:hypothetical protein